MNAKKILIIVPCFNESKRLTSNEFLNYANENLQFIFADDGSTDNTLTMISELSNTSPNIHFYTNTQNKGKAEVVRNAFYYATENLPEFNFYGYWDADLATPLWEIENMFVYASLYDQKFNAIFGSRVYKLGSQIERSPLRHILGRIFATIVGNLLKVKAYDTQCGAKIFDAKTAELAFANPYISRWVFDVEILLRLKEVDILEYPLKQWKDIKGSKVKIFQESFRILSDITQIYKKYIKENN